MTITLNPSSRPLLGTSDARVRLSPSREQDPGPKLLTPSDFAASQELDPLIMLGFGRRGDGKTLWMALTLYIMLQSYIKHGNRPTPRNPNGFKIASNIHMQFADFCNPALVDMLINYESKLRRMQLGIDEILSFLPSRRTMARVNVDAANALVQIRKDEMEIVTTTQKPQNIDSQMLDQIDLFVLPLLYNRRWVPVREIWTHKMTGRMQYKPTSMRLLIWDWWGNFTGKQYSKRWPPQMSGEQPDYTIDYHNIHEIFSWFHTKEKVPSIWHRNRANVIIEQWEEEMTQMAAELAPDVIDEEADAGRVIATIDDLIAAQGDDVMVASLLNEAKAIDKNIKGTRELALRMEQAGYHVQKEGRYGYRALKLEG